MGFVSRRHYEGVWSPDSDPVNGSPTRLLRGDNLVLDEHNVPALRRGSLRIFSALGSRVHSLFTTLLAGIRYRMAGVDAKVFSNGTDLGVTMSGGGDTAFGFHSGQILFARGTTTKKFDGITVRNWGIAMTGAAPTAVAVDADGKTFATGAASETPPFVIVESSDGPGDAAAVFAPNHYPTSDPLYDATGAVAMNPRGDTYSAIYQRTFATPQDFTTYDAGQIGNDDDIISFYLWVSDTKWLKGFAVEIDCNEGAFINDFYVSPWLAGYLPATTLGPNAGATLPVPAAGAVTHPTDLVPILSGAPLARVGLPVGLAGGTNVWGRIAFKRSDFVRAGTTDGKDWSTVRSIRIVMQAFKYSYESGTLIPPITARFEGLRITCAEFLGTVAWRYVYVRNASGYTALSGPSPSSTPTMFSTHAVDLTAPADAARDPQVNEIWFYRQDQTMETFYRSIVKAPVSGTGAVTVRDSLRRQEVLTIDIPIELDNLVPPANIIGIAGPHFDRTIVLTSDGMVWVSRRLDPDAFAASQALRVAGKDEVPLWIYRAVNDLFIGTTKDVYRLDGTGAELPDGSMDFSLRGLSIDHRPLNPGVAHEGNQLVFFSDDGWRASSGMGTQLLTADTSLLYKGQARHGVGPVNMAGRVRAALGRSQLWAITPEGTGPGDTSCVIYRYVFARQIWYRQTFGSANFLSIIREPDGTLVAGDDAGSVWALDQGTTDDGALLAVTLWTKADDLDNPYQRKVLGDLMWRSETGGATAAIAVHRDASTIETTHLSYAQPTPDVTPFDLGNALAPHKIPICRHVQFRLTGTFPSFHLYDVGVQFRERPVPIIGRVVDSRAGSPGIKLVSGFVITCNTFGVPRVITAYFDGTSADGEQFTITTDPEEMHTLTLDFTRYARRVTDIGFAVDGEIEIESWSPIVSQHQPIGVKVWDSGPIDLGTRELVWLRELQVKVRAGADLYITPYFDGKAFPTVTARIDAPNVDTILRVPVGRAYVGRQPRLVIESCAPFFPYWIKPIRRVTGQATQKVTTPIPVTLQTGGG